MSQARWPMTCMIAMAGAASAIAVVALWACRTDDNVSKVVTDQDAISDESDDAKTTIGSEPDDKAVACRAARVPPALATLEEKDSQSTGQLVHLLHDSQMALVGGQRCSVLAEIANRAAFTEHSDLIREKGGLDSVLDALADPDENVQRNALWAIGNLAVTALNQPSLAAAIPTIVTKLREMSMDCQLGTDNDVQKNHIKLALHALLNLAGDDATHAVMQSEKLFPILADLMSKDDQPDLQLLATRILVNLSLNEANSLPLVSAGAMHPLFALLWRDDDELLLRVLVATTNILHALRDPAQFQGHGDTASQAWQASQRCLSLLDTTQGEVLERTAALLAELKFFL